MQWLLCFVTVVVAGLVNSVDPEANGQKAARFLGLGYNLLRADPDAAGNGGVDPGFLTTRRVVDVASNGRETFPRRSCVIKTSTSTVFDEESFQSKFDLSVALEAGVSSEVAEARFGLSTSFSQAKDITTKLKMMSYESQTLCNYGGARMSTELSVNFASRGFQAAVCNLPATYDKAAYIKFINDWGTSVVHQVDVGVRNLTKKTESFSSVYNSMQRALGVSTSTSVSYSTAFVSASGSIEMNMNTVKNSAKFSESFKGTGLSKVIGTDDYPEPIFVKVGSIHEVLTAAYFSGNSPAACTSAKKAQLSTKQNYLARALNEYPAAMQVRVHESTGKVRIPLKWPRGTYGLAKPKTGCPPNWASDGARKWDDEDVANRNWVTGGHHFDGSFGSDTVLRFCVKTLPFTNALTDVDWPVGEYCLFKYRQCPSGFRKGIIHWDDEDFNNRNDVWGTLPDGGYGRDTDIHYCCRTDGENTLPIFLPTSKPFYLMQATRYGCQKVAGMRVRTEYIFQDTEDLDNKDSHSGLVPLNGYSSRDRQIHYCYYY